MKKTTVYDLLKARAGDSHVARLVQALDELAARYEVGTADCQEDARCVHSYAGIWPRLPTLLHDLHITLCLLGITVVVAETCRP